MVITIKFLDLFAGIGGFRRGLELDGHKCVGFCEFDKFAAASYISMHLLTERQREYLSTLDLKKRQKEILKYEYRNGEWYADDIRNVHAGNVPKCDCWCFGAPCQDFSVAGKRAGLDGNRSSLVREVFRIIREIREEDRPRWLIYENVKGMLSSNRGFDFLAILLEMDELGYDCEWQIFNSKDWGVPQNRERVYTVGHLRRYGSAKIFPIERTDGEDCVREVIGNGGNHEPKIAIPIATISDSQDGIVYAPDHVSQCLSAGHNNQPKVCLSVLTPDREEKRQNGRRFKENGEEMFTLTAQDRHGVALEVEPLGGIYWNQSPNYQREILDGKIRTLKSDGNHPQGVALGILRNIRSEYGKEIRKQYENGEIDISRHKFLEQEIREDGISNTIDSVQKDNLLCVDVYDAYNSNWIGNKNCGTLTANGMTSNTHVGTFEIAVKVADSQEKEHPSIYIQLSEDLTVYAVWYEKYGCYIAVRKLTPKECFRLQGWTDDYFEKAQFVNSDSQLYKQAGNGVTVNVVYEIGKALSNIERG